MMRPGGIAVLVSCLMIGFATGLRAPVARSRCCVVKERRSSCLAGRSTGGEDVLREPASTLRWLGGLAAVSAPLGPVCDNLHSGFGVLRYDALQIRVGSAPAWWGDGVLFQTAWWVPPLFALAGVIIGGLDAVVASRVAPPSPELAAPSTARVAAAVAAFVALYAVSAVGAGLPPSPGLGLSPLALSGLLWPLALALWAGLDPSLSSFVAGAATAVGGPCIEIALLGAGGAFPEPAGHLYAYVHPDVFGVASWIPAVYFAGGPAVALVSRWIRTRA